MGESGIEADGRPPFDPKMATLLVGKSILLGLTYLRQDGTLLRRVQLHGEVIRADDAGVAIRVAGSGEVYRLPPDLRGMKQAPVGEYRLKSTGEVVVNPDYVASWTITEPPGKEVASI
jgi:hypothetical protein